MIPNSYATDTQTKATELASTVAAAVTPPQIASACAAVESYLRNHTVHQQRWFFSITFPTLICRIFGFDDSSPPSTATKRSPSNGWLDVCATEIYSELSNKIFSLLSPNGLLLSSISGIDRLSLVKYVFPNERLPEWVRCILQNEQQCHVLSDLCPLFKNRINGSVVKGSPYQVELNVFEYYLFWFVYHPVCRGNNEGSQTIKVQWTKKFRLENWSYSIPGLSSTKREIEKKTECNLYIRLLYVYLHSFVPSRDFYVHQPYRSSLLHYSPGYDGSAIQRAEFVINTMINFWLVDNDFSLLSPGLCKANGGTFPFKSVLGETPPTSGLGDVINVFVKYLNLSSLEAMNGLSQPEYARNSGWSASGSFDVVKSRDVLSMHSFSSWILLIQRPLYRFILRTFLFCPVESSITNVSQAFSVWVNYLEPWSISFEEFVDLNESLGLPTGSSANCFTKSSTPGYLSSWQGYVLDNYLFYCSLVMHFVGFAHKFLHTDAEIIVQMVAKVMQILTSSVELMDLIKNVDTVFHSKAAESSKSVHSSFSRYLPTIRQKLQDWEDGLCESDADGSFLHENWNKDLRLFADAEDGGQQLLQLFLLRAESELQSISGINLSQNLQCLDSLKSQLSLLFGGSITKSKPETPRLRNHHQSRDEIFKPRSFNKKIGDEVKYKASFVPNQDEIAWLASFLIKISAQLNEKLGLNQVNRDQVGVGWSYLEVQDEVGSVYGAKGTLKVVLCGLLSWVVWLIDCGLQLMRRYGLRVNLRMLASKKVALMVLVFSLIYTLKRAFV